MRQRVIFLDRDGTINVDFGYVVQASDWQFCEGAVKALRCLRDAAYRIVIVTNQSGIARGKYSLSEVDRLHQYVRSQLATNGVFIDAIVVCPHAPTDQCNCRKPKTAMAEMAESILGAIDFGKSWMVGDKLSDYEFGRAIGSRTALIRSRYWSDELLTSQPTLVVGSLLEAARLIVDEG